MGVVYYQSRLDSQCMPRPQGMSYVQKQFITGTETMQKFYNTDDRDLVKNTDATNINVVNFTDALRGQLSEESASLAVMKVFYERKLSLVFLERICSR